MTLSQSQNGSSTFVDNEGIGDILTDTTTIIGDTTDIQTDMNVPAQNGTDNIKINDVIGNRTDKSFSNYIPYPSIIGHLMAAYNHVHSSSIIYPINSAPITVTSGAGAYTEGAKTTIIAAVDAPALLFDIHWVVVGDISANDDYVMKLYTGDIDNESLWGETSFIRDVNTLRGFQFPIQGPPIPAGTRVSASLMSGSGSDSADIKLYVHTYNGVTGV